jgi:SAM-dependent methyltransferase
VRLLPTNPVIQPQSTRNASREHPIVTPTAALRHIVDRASDRFRLCGKFAYYFARGKLSTDPLFATLLSLQLLPKAPRLLDLGCGQGLVGAWLAAANQCALDGYWPPTWLAPPRPVSIRGIEINRHEVRRAQRALGGLAQIECGDLRQAELHSADAILMLDVLQYLDPGEQKSLIERARAALSGNGVLLLRIGDAGGGVRFTWSRWVDATIWRIRGRRRAVLNFRTLAEWLDLLRSAGFAAREIPMVGARSFANVLLLATPEPDVAIDP